MLLNVLRELFSFFCVPSTCCLDLVVHGLLVFHYLRSDPDPIFHSLVPIFIFYSFVPRHRWLVKFCCVYSDSVARRRKSVTRGEPAGVIGVVCVVARVPCRCLDALRVFCLVKIR